MRARVRMHFSLRHINECIQSSTLSSNLPMLLIAKYLPKIANQGYMHVSYDDTFKEAKPVIVSRHRRAQFDRST